MIIFFTYNYSVGFMQQHQDYRLKGMPRMGGGGYHHPSRHEPPAALSNG
jgi:hypothetical protein